MTMSSILLQLIPSLAEVLVGEIGAMHPCNGVHTIVVAVHVCVLKTIKTKKATWKSGGYIAMI